MNAIDPNLMTFTRRTIAAAAGLLAAAQISLKASPAPAKTKRVYSSESKTSILPLYSDAVSYGDLVFCSGHGVDTPQGIQGQTKTVLDEIGKVLERAGSSFDKALKCNVYLAHIEDYGAMNEVYRGRFGDKPPARTTVAVAAIPLKGCLVEIEVIAHR